MTKTETWQGRSVRADHTIEELAELLGRKDNPVAQRVTCAECGDAFNRLFTGEAREYHPLGRRPRYCSNRCKQAAYRKRKAAKRAAGEEAVAFMESFDASSLG
jgi:hypothetical protein